MVMEKTIDLNQTLYELCSKHPDIIPIMVQLGFENITKSGMLQTAGRVMTIPKGCRMKDIPLQTVITTFQENGFIIKE